MSFQLFVARINGDGWDTVEVHSHNKVKDIFDKLEINNDDNTIKLWSGSNMLDGNRQIGDSNLVTGCSLHMTLPVYGGAKVGKPLKGKTPKGEGNQEAAYADLVEKKRRQELNDAAKKAALEARKQLLSRMDEEAKHTKMNQFRIQNQWRKIMRLAKVESLRKDIEIMSQNHERDVDRKDAWIVLLDRDLEEAEEQYQMSLRSHLQNIDRLINIQDSRLLELEKEFERELNLLEVEFRAEGDAIRKQHSRECKALMDIMSTVEALEAEKEAEAMQEHEQFREEIKNKNDEDTHVLRVTLETSIDELENHFESAHLNYLQNTDQRTQDFKRLTRKDQDSSKESGIKARKIARLESKIAHWRTKISQNKKECEERNSALKAEKDIISNHFQELKTRMNKFRSAQSSRLNALTQNARTAKSISTDKIKLAERILTLAELARKMETEREKIMPFYASSLTGEALEVKGDQAEGSDDHDKGEINMALGSGTEGETIESHQSYGLNTETKKTVPEWSYLDNFIKKYNKVLLDKVAISKEKERLEQENQDLQNILKQYLDGISVNEDVLRSANPLLVINGKVNLNTQPQRHGPINVVVEANHMINTRRVS
jgi:hypothetical protein